jgi:hypothetical protein
MGAVGLLDDVNAVDVGMAEMRRLIRQGIRRLDAAALAEIIAEKRLERGASRATLLVQQLDKDPLPELATAAVDWVDLFEGDEPGARRQLREPSGWNEVLRAQLREAVAEVKQQGHRDVLVAGKMRLSTGLVAGVELSDVAGFAVAIRQRDDEWSSSGDRAEVELERHEVEVGQGDELAIGISFAADLTDDVVAYLRAEGIPISRFVNFLPAGGASRSAISGPEEARGYAQALLDALRTETASTSQLHLFQAGPLGLSLLLGHVWNRLPEAQLYEDLGAGAGYTATFRLAG